MDTTFYEYWSIYHKPLLPATILTVQPAAGYEMQQAVWKVASHAPSTDVDHVVTFVFRSALAPRAVRPQHRARFLSQSNVERVRGTRVRGGV